MDTQGSLSALLHSCDFVHLYKKNMSPRWTPVQKGSIVERVDCNRKHYNCLLGWLCVVNVHCTLCVAILTVDCIFSLKWKIIVQILQKH